MMLRLLMLAGLAAPAHAVESEWKVGLVGALELPGLASQSPTDFDLATWATGAQVSYGLAGWLHLGARLIYSQVEGVIDDYSFTDISGTRFDGTLLVDMSAWRTEALAEIRVLRGMAIEPYVTLAGGYTWTVYNNPTLSLAEGDVGLDTANSDDFAQGTLTLTATLSAAYRILPFLEITAGVEVSHYVDGLYQSAVRFPLGVTGAFWGPM